MKHLWKYMSLICYELFAAFLIWALIKGTAGIIAAVLFIIVVTVMMCIGKIENSDVKCPLLLDILLMSVNFILIDNVNVWPITVPLGLGAAFDIVNRIVNRTYNTDSLLDFLKSEIRLPADLELVVFVLLAIGAYEHNGFHEPVIWIILAVFAVDFVRQKAAKREAKKHLAK